MVKFECRFNSDAAKALRKHSFKKIWWCFVCITVLMAFVGAMCILEDGQLVLGILFIVLGVLFCPFCLLISVLGQKNSDKTFSLLSNQTVSSFVFEQDKMSVETIKGTEYHEIVDAAYSYLYRVEETAEHYFLYTNNRAALVVTKADLTEGSIEELNDIFARNLGTNFKAQKRNK